MPTTFSEKGLNGAFNGATAVDIVPVPGSGETRIVREITIANEDTVAHTFSVIVNRNGTLSTLRFAVDAAGVLFLPMTKVLDATTSRIQGKIEGAHTTTAPTFDVAFGAEVTT